MNKKLSDIAKPVKARVFGHGGDPRLSVGRHVRVSRGFRLAGLRSELLDDLLVQLVGNILIVRHSSIVPPFCRAAFLPVHFTRARAHTHLLVLRSSTRAPTSFPTYKYEQLAFHVCKGSVHARTRCEMEWNRMLMFNRASSNLLEVQAGETWRFFAKKIGIADIK